MNFKIIVFAPLDSTDELITAMSNAGAGIIGNYTSCAFVTTGYGNWKSGNNSNPTVGKAGELSREKENRIEMVCAQHLLKEVVKAIKKVHPYETPVIDIIKLEDLDL